jgi:hypothetical protein
MFLERMGALSQGTRSMEETIKGCVIRLCDGHKCLFLLKWRLHCDHNGLYTLKTENGKHLGVEGPARDGAMLIAAPEAQPFNIWPDEYHSGAYKFVIPHGSPVRC